VTFEQWQYGNNPAFPPADGISFFLTDGAAELTRPGAFGGSLGYAQKLPDDDPANPFLPGVDNGYLGTGLDVLGNYFGDWEHRGYGRVPLSPAGTIFRVPAPGPNMVTVRGPGDGTVGYCWLTATTSNFTTTPPWPSTLPGQLQGTLTSISGVHAGRLGSGKHDPDTFGAEHLIEQRGELAVPITNQKLERPGPLPQIHHQVPGLLRDPASGRMCGDTQDMHPAGGVLDDREAVQPGERDRLAMEEITSEDPFGLGTQELSPGRPDLRGAGSIPAFFKINHTVDGAILRPRPASSPAILR
jgi:hypothetical protein